MQSEDSVNKTFVDYKEAIAALYEQKITVHQARADLNDERDRIVGQGVEGKNAAEREAAVKNATVKHKGNLDDAERDMMGVESTYHQLRADVRLIEILNTLQEQEIAILAQSGVHVDLG